MTKSVSIQDIADHFGVSLSTISRALNDCDDISPETRRKVLAYAKEVGYRSQRATSIKGTLGILWGSTPMPNSSLSVLADTFSSIAAQSRYLVETYEIGNDFDAESFFPEHNLCGALILNVGYNSPLYLKLRNIAHPIVLFNSQISDNHFVSGVRTNDVVSASEAVNYLVSLGHSQIGYIGDSCDPYLNAERFAGYLLGLQTNAIPYRFDLTYNTDPSFKGGETAAEYYLRYSKFITAVLCTSEEVAAGFISTMQKAGQEIPKDISVISYCDSVPPQDEPLGFTTIMRDGVKLGEQAFDVMKAMLRGLHAMESTVPSSLTDKEKSCAPKPSPFPTDAD